MYKGVNPQNLESNRREMTKSDQEKGTAPWTKERGGRPLRKEGKTIKQQEATMEMYSKIMDAEVEAAEAEAEEKERRAAEITERNKTVVRKKSVQAAEKPRCICEGCGRNFKQRLDGKPCAHNCVNGKKNVSETTDAEGRPSRNTIARDRARNNKNLQRTKMGQPVKIYESSDEDSDDRELLGDLGKRHARTINGRESVEMSRQRRRRRQTLNEFDAEHRNLVRLAAEEDITKYEFSARVGAILDHTPPDFLSIATTVGNNQAGGKRDTAAGRHQTEPSMIGRQEEMRDNDDEYFFDIDDLGDEGHQNNGQKLTKEGQILKEIHKHMRNGDMSKARRVIVNGGIFDITTPEGSGLLKSKYPIDEARREQGEQYEGSAENERQKIQSVASGLDRTAARENLTRYIKTRKRGAARASTGHCHDHYRSMIERDPSATDDLVAICDKIAGGSMIDGEASAKLVRGKGTPLSKGGGVDVRPTSTLHPILNYTGMLLIKMTHERIREVCGSEQLAMERSGVEKQGHAIRAMLEQDHEIVTGVCDVWNAYNAPTQTIAAETVRENVVELAELTDLLMSRTPTEVVFTDRKTGQVHVTQMLRGMTQGGTNSTATFCVVLAVKVTSVLKVEFEDLSILCISDNITFSGRPMRVVQCFERCVLLLKDGMGCVASMPKSTIYGLGRHYPEDARQRARELGIKWIDSDQGFVSAGVPIGSHAFMEETVEKTADRVIAELAAIQAIALSPLSSHYNTLQTMSAMIRMCSTSQMMFLLRVVPPEMTYRSSRRVDIAVVNTISNITDSLRFMAPEHTDRLTDQLQTLFSPASLGGMGYMSAVDSREGAYVASVLACAKFIADTVPVIRDLATSKQLTGSLDTFAALIVQMQENGCKSLENIDPYGSNMWGVDMLGMQKKINGDKLRAAADQLMAGIPAGGRDPRTGDIDHEGTAQRVRMLNNQNKIASAWRTANAGYRENFMTNAEYSMAFALCMGLPVAGSRISCVCGACMDSLCEHALVCPATKVRAKLRNNLHSSYVRESRKVAILGGKGGDYTVETGSPAVGRFLQAKDGRDTTKLFSDIATLKNGGAGHVILADITTTHPSADYVTEDFRKRGVPYRPGMAAEIGVTRKAAHYSEHFHTDQRVVAETVEMVTLSFETSGAVDSKTEQWIRERAADIARGRSGMGPHDTPQSEDTALALRQIYQRYSVSLHAWKARAVAYTVKHFSLDSRPVYPYVPGSNCSLIQPEPPAFIGLLTNRGRRYVLTPLPARGQQRDFTLRRQ